MEHWYLYLAPGFLSVIWLAVLIARRIPGLWQSTDRFNSTSDWIPTAPHEQLSFPHGTTGFDRGPRFIAPYLEAGETLEGFAFAFFSPPRPQDWGFTLGPHKNPVLIGVTARRMLLFQLNSYPQFVVSKCFLEYDAIQFLHPPKPLWMGLSGLLRFGLPSGLEYQFSFLGPMVYPEFLEEEQRLAAYLRWLAPRIGSPGTGGSREVRLTA